MKKLRELESIFNNKELTKQIKLYFSTKSIGSDYDSYEKNYTYTELNPKTIRGVVSELSPEALVWKEYGLSEIGAVELICLGKHRSLFENCTRVEIDSNSYAVLKDATGNRAVIQGRYNDQTIRVVLFRK